MISTVINGYLYTFRILYTVTYLYILWYLHHRGAVADQHAHFEAMGQATAVLTCVCPKSGHILRIVPRPRLFIGQIETHDLVRNLAVSLAVWVMALVMGNSL